MLPVFNLRTTIADQVTIHRVKSMSRLIPIVKSYHNGKSYDYSRVTANMQVSHKGIQDTLPNHNYQGLNLFNIYISL